MRLKLTGKAPNSKPSVCACIHYTQILTMLQKHCDSQCDSQRRDLIWPVVCLFSEPVCLCTIRYVSTVLEIQYGSFLLDWPSARGCPLPGQ